MKKSSQSPVGKTATINSLYFLKTTTYQLTTLPLIHDFIRAATAGKSFWFRFKSKAHTQDIAHRFT